MIDVSVRGPDGRQIGAMQIHCIEGTGRDPDSVNVYAATLRHYNHYDHRSDPPTRDRRVTFEHRFGDGWPVLVREALEAMEITP